MECADHEAWVGAMDKEMEGLIRLNVFMWVRENEMNRGGTFIPNKWVYKIKPEKYKARLVMKGFMEHNHGDTYSPTLKLVTLRLIFALSAVYGFEMLQMDVCNAFVNADAPSNNVIYTNCPNGYEKEGWVLKLNKALYGLKGSPRAWYEHIHNFLTSLGLVASVLDVCLFTYSMDSRLVLLVGLFVDDLIIGGIHSCVTWFKKGIQREFLMEDLGEPKRVIGIDVDITQDYILINQPSYIDKVIKKFNMDDCTPKRTPMETKLKLTKDMCEDNEKVQDFPYRSLVMSLLYLSICTRFDIANTCKELCRFLEKPGSAMVSTAKRVVRYLKGCKHFGLKFYRGWRADKILDVSSNWSPNSPVKTYTDADWAGQADTSRSTAGMILLFNGTTISWYSKTLKVIALSSQDAEYMALSDGSREIIFIRQLLETLGFKLSPTELYGDNSGSLAVSNNPAAHQKTKHIRIRFHFIRQTIKDNEIKTVKIPTGIQLADVLTKPLHQDQHWLLINMASGHIFCDY